MCRTLEVHGSAIFHMRVAMSHPSELNLDLSRNRRSCWRRTSTCPPGTCQYLQVRRAHQWLRLTRTCQDGQVRHRTLHGVGAIEDHREAVNPLRLQPQASPLRRWPSHRRSGNKDRDLQAATVKQRAQADLLRQLERLPRMMADLLRQRKLLPRPMSQYCPSRKRTATPTATPPGSTTSPAGST